MIQSGVIQTQSSWSLVKSEVRMHGDLGETNYLKVLNRETLFHFLLNGAHIGAGKPYGEMQAQE